MSKFKVGDKVKILDAVTDADKIGQIREVVCVDECSVYLEGCGSWWKNTEGLEIVNSKTIMSNIKDFAKNLVLSADEKLLKKQGLKNECGDYTSDAKELVLEKLTKENESYLLEIAKAKEEEEGKDK